MSFATSSPVVNSFAGIDVSTATRTHLLANVPLRPIEQAKNVAQAIRGSVKIHPLRLAKIMRRGCVRLSYFDLIN